MKAPEKKTISRSSRKAPIAFACAILILLVVGVVSYHGIAVLSESSKWVQHTHEVLDNLQDLRAAMGNIESSVRGFALTGKASYLESYRANRVIAQQSEASIRSLTADNASQQPRLAALDRLAAQKRLFGETVIGLRQTKGLEAAAAITQVGNGQQIADEMGAVIRDLRVEEIRSLALREVDVKRRLGQVKIVLILGTILGLLIAVAASWSVQRSSSRDVLAKEALRESKERYRLLLDGVRGYAIFMLDARGQVISWNAGAERIKGYKAEEIIGHNFSSFYPPEDIQRGKPEEMLRMTAESGQHEAQGMRVRKDGTRFLANISLTALRDSAGELRGFSEISRDLSESKESEARYRGLLEAAPDAMVVVNQGGEIVLLNAQAEKQFGYRRDELLEQKVTNIIPEGFAERLIADGNRTAAEALAQQIGTGIELSGRRKDGSEFPIEIMLSPLESAEGILVTAAIRNISVRRAAEKHLAQMEGRYRGLLEAAPDAMVVVNQSGEIVLLNAQAEKRFGYRRDELLGQKVTNIIPEGFAERLIADGTRTAAEALAQQIGMGLELSGRRKDGSEFPIELMLSPLESSEGILVTAAIRDISMRKIAEAHLVKTVADLKRSNDELQQFAYVASHDLQEPLRTVASFTQLLAKRYQGKLDADADEFISYAVDGCNRMKELIQDLLAYSRAGAEGKALAEISGENALQRATHALEMIIKESGAIVTHDLLPTITTDLGQLTQVFQNLVGNAIKYRGVEVPQVHVSARQNGGNEWIFSVRDNGLGIDPQYFEKIFVIFQRLHGREAFAGTGIGLSICKKIVERLGGRIWVESQVKKGSTFYFALPERNGK